MTDLRITRDDSGKEITWGDEGKTLMVGQTVYQTTLRDYVRVTVSCQHGEEDKWYDTNHDDEKTHREARWPVIKRAVELHRANLLDQHRVVCNCRIPDSLRTDRDD